MKNKFTQLIITFMIAFSASFITDLVPYQYLGDWKCKGSKSIEVLDHYSDGQEYFHHQTVGCQYASIDSQHGPTKHWGFRHWLLIVMGIVLFFYRIIVIFN